MSSDGDRPRSIPALAEALERRAGARHSAFFDFGGWRLELRASSEPVVDAVDSYLELFRAEPGPSDALALAYETEVPELPFSFFDWKRNPGKVGKKEQVADIEGGWIVRKVRTGMHFLLGSGRRIAVGPCLRNYIQIVNFINAVYIASKIEDDWVLCHAAGIALDGRGVGLAGTSGAGKSTLALHAMNQNLSFVSNDRLLIKLDNKPTMSGVPKHPRINPGTALNNPTLSAIVPADRRAELERMSTAELWSLEEKYDADIGSLYEGRWAMTTELAGFILLDWKLDNGPARIERIDLAERPDLWPALLKSPGPLHVDFGERRIENTIDVAPEPYLQVLRDVPVYEISGGVDFEVATQECLRILRKQ